ncbi:MAG: hypothetical protein RR322_02030 [Oscillospiraceae bacterium]
MGYKPMVLQNIPSAPTKQYKIESFRGADLTTEAANVNSSRSPQCPNMIRETGGKVRKWIGYKTTKKYSGRINAVHEYLLDKTYTLIHAGKNIYLKGEPDTLLYEQANDEKSISFQVDKRLYILDGLKMLAFGEFDNPDFVAGGTEPAKKLAVKKVEDIAYVPTILISRNPSGGGTPFEPINLISKKRSEHFLADGSNKVYQLSANEIDVDEVVCEKIDGNGGKVKLKENTDFTVERKSGKVTFNIVPPKPTISGQDNVFITYSKTVKGYAERINKCNIGILYGIGGSRDRLFVTGSDEFKNRDYYSQLNDPTYFGDLWYCVMGQDNSKIIGYSVVSDKLAAHLDKSADDTNIILRKGEILQGEAFFLLAGALQGVGAVSSRSFAVLEGEPLFLSNEGIFAVTPSDILGERYSQLRSYYLNGLLLKQNLKTAYAVAYDGFYMLAVGEYIFALDSTQYAREDTKPFSHRQYEGYYRTGINARVLFINGKNLCFGTEDGRICEFYTDYGDINNFNDDGKAINANWLTPEIIGQSFYKEKTFKRISIYLGASVATGTRIWGLYDGLKELLIDYNANARFFDFSFLNFCKFTFKTDRTPQVIGGKRDGKIKISRQQGMSFLFENDVINEPFGLYSASAEFIER